jgi:hypothetical protein
MFWWVVDNAFWLYVAFALAFLALAPAYWVTREWKYLISLGVVLVLTGLVWLLSLLIVTDRKQLYATVLEMADAVVAKKPDGVVKHLATSFHFKGRSKASAREGLAYAIRQNPIENINIRDFSVLSLSRENRTAEVEFRAYVTSGRDIVNVPVWCKADFVLEGDDAWRLETIRITHGFVNSNQEVPIPLP